MPTTFAPTAREIDGPWPARARSCRDNPCKVYRVIDGSKLTRLAAATSCDSALFVL